MSAAGAGIHQSPDFPGPALSFEFAAEAETTPIGSAHDTFAELIPTIIQRLNVSDDAAESKKKRVQVRGFLYASTHPNIRFLVDFKAGKVDKLRIMTVVPTDEDLAKVPEKYGGTGLMAADSDDDKPAPAAKRARKAAAPKEETLGDVLAKAVELARLQNREALMHALDALLKSF